MKFISYFIGFIFLISLAQCASASVLNVGEGQTYPTIQSAITASTAGDTVLVYPGTYMENITISKQLTIEGQSGNSEDVIINTNGSANTILVSANGVILKYISANDNLINNNAAVKLNSVDNCIIDNCAFKRNTLYGIHNYDSYNTTIKNCYIAGLYSNLACIGIRVQAIGSTPIDYNVSISNCTLWDAAYNLHLSYANGCKIDDCYVQNSVYFVHGNANVFRNCVFSKSIKESVKLMHFDTSNDNLFYNNVFLFNGTSISYAGTCTNNSFSLPSPINGSGIAGGSQIGGNIWTTESLTDADSNGFADSAFTVVSGINATDNYPVMINTSTAGYGSALSPSWIGPSETSLEWDVCNDPLFEKYVLYRGKEAIGRTNYPVFETTSVSTHTFTDSNTDKFPGRREYYTLETRYSNGTSYYSSAECWSIHHMKNWYWVEGDSISTNPYAISGQEGWSEQLQRDYLIYEGWIQKNTAVDGQTVNDSMSDYQLTAQRTESLVMMDAIGINDYIMDKRDVNDTFLDVQYEVNYSAVRGAKVYWLLLLPKNDQIVFQRTFNWRAIADHPPNVTVVNTYDSIDTIIENGNFDAYNDTLESQDTIHVHPNTAGGKLIADKVFLSMCLDQIIENESYYPHGESTITPSILTALPYLEDISYSGTTNFSATTSIIADSVWYINGVFMNIDKGSMTPEMPLNLTSDDYTISLKAMNPANYSASTTYTWALMPPVAAFTANNTSTTAPADIQFTDNSTHDPTSWAWDFNGDSIVDSTEQNPVYTYSTDGTYTVSLTATNDAGSDTETKTDYIHLTNPYVAPIVLTSVAAAVLFMMARRRW